MMFIFGFLIGGVLGLVITSILTVGKTSDLEAEVSKLKHILYMREKRER